MRKQFLVFGVGIVYFFSSFLMTACNSGSEQNQELHDDHEHHDSMHHEEGDHHNEAHTEAVYMCPMKCEGDKTYAEAGTCPECGMDLTLVTDEDEEEEEEDHHHEH